MADKKKKLPATGATVKESMSLGACGDNPNNKKQKKKDS